MCVVWISEQKAKFAYTALIAVTTEMNVFTARYELIFKQIRLRFLVKGLKVA
jgi:hypothetical protein